MSFYAMAWALRHPTGTSSQKLALISLADAYNEEMGYAFPSLEVMQEQTSLSRNGLKKALAELTAKDEIEVFERRTETGRQTSNGYLLTAYQGATGRPLPSARKSKGNATRGSHSGPSGGHTVAPNLEEEPLGSSTRNATPSRRGKKSTPRPADEDNIPSREVTTGEYVEESASSPKKTTTLQRRDYSQLSAAAESADSPYCIALRFKELMKQRDAQSMSVANLREFSAAMKRWHVEGTELSTLKMMVDRFCKNPDPYMSGSADIPWRAFINSRAKLLADSRKIEKATAPKAAGGMLARAAQRAGR